MNDEHRKRGRTLIPVALATLAAAVALPVSGALAGGGDPAAGDGSNTTLEQPGIAPAQDRQGDQARPDRGDCPEGHGGGQDGDQGSGSTATEL